MDRLCALLCAHALSSERVELLPACRRADCGVGAFLVSSAAQPPRGAVWRLVAFVDGRTLDAEVTFDTELDHLAPAVRDDALAAEVLDPENGWRDPR